MKKLLAILVILMLAAPMFAGTDILNFMWFHNKLGFSGGDVYRISDNSPQNDAQFHNINYYCFLEELMFGMWGTAYEGDNLSITMDWFNYTEVVVGDIYSGFQNGSAQAMYITENQQFYARLNVGDIYTLGLGAKGAIRVFPFQLFVDADDSGSNTGTEDVNGVHIGFSKFKCMLENRINIPNIMTIDLNFAMYLQWGWDNYPNGPSGMDDRSDMFLDFTLKLGGSYSFGFSWYLNEIIILALNLENYKDNDPEVHGTIIANGAMTETELFKNVPIFQTQLGIAQEVLGLAGVENVTLTIKADDNFMIVKPWSNGLEYATLIHNQFKVGVDVGFYGFNVGLYFIGATNDFARAAANTWDTTGWNEPRGRIGLLLAAGYNRGFFDFGIAYQGLAEVRDNDLDGNAYATPTNPNDTQWGYTADNGGLFREPNAGDNTWTNLITVTFGFAW